MNVTHLLKSLRSGVKIAMEIAIILCIKRLRTPWEKTLLGVFIHQKYQSKRYYATFLPFLADLLWEGKGEKERKGEEEKERKKREEEKGKGRRRRKG